MTDYVLKVLNKSKKGLTREEIYEKVERRIKKDDSSFNSLSKNNIIEIDNIINELIDNVDIVEIGGKYKAIKNTSFYKGIYHRFGSGKGKVVVDMSYLDGDNNLVIDNNEYMVDAKNSGNALDGDFVLVDVPSKGQNRIYKVINNCFEEVYGTIDYDNNWGYCLKPVNKKLNGVFISISDIEIEDNHLYLGARVKVKLDRKNNSNELVLASIEEKLPHKDDPGKDIYWEALKYGMDNDFSEASWKQVDAIPTKVLDTEKIGRSDFTKENIFTIDGIHTKDMDDAVSCNRLPNGNYLLGVHIADVSHYVKKYSPLDVDAYRKSTSTYAFNTVIPMLPHELSNGICSLNPNVDRLTISCLMEIDNNGEVVNYNILKSVINSKLKMSYDKVNNILKGESIPEGYDDYVESLNLLNKVSLILRKKRLLDGSIEFNVSEKEVLFDDNDNMIGVGGRDNDVAENLIEECMVVANETVDKHLSMLGAPCLHRIHDTPNQNKVSELIRLLNIIGYRYNTNNVNECITNPRCMQDLIDYVEDISIGDNLSKKAIQTMSRAKYSPNNIGHYGLGKDNYCHFTSPIRRYPDLVVHRLLDEYHFNEDNEKITSLDLVSIGRHTSQKEKDADEVERSVFRLKCAQYMQDYVGEDFNATIVDVVGSGLIVDLDNNIEGFISLDQLKEDEGNAHFEIETLSIKTNNNTYRFGDRLNVKVLKNDDVLPLHYTDEDKENYIIIVSEKDDLLDDKKTYLKINNKINTNTKGHIKTK